MHWTKFFIDDEPELGDERIRSAFLWLPKAVRDETRWLVHATWRERYVWTRLGTGREVKAWRGVEWIDEDEQHADRGAASTDSRAEEDGFVETVLRGGSYDGERHTIHRKASSLEVRSGAGFGRVQVEAYKRTGEEDGRPILEHAGTWMVDLTDGADEQ